MISKTVSINYPRIKEAGSIEDILCLATLIAKKELSSDSLIYDSERYHERILGCENCNHSDTCLACIING